MRVLRSADHKRMPWKNGGGMTLQLAISPAGAGLEDFAWRISSAQVAMDGAFSCFPGIDRSLAVLAGIARDVVKGHPVDGDVLRAGERGMTG